MHVKAHVTNRPSYCCNHHHSHAGRCIGGAVAMIIGVFLLAFAVMWLWNALLPDLFGWKTIGYWQAWMLMLLSKLLFGRFGHGHRWHRHHCNCKDDQDDKFVDFEYTDKNATETEIKS